MYQIYVRQSSVLYIPNTGEEILYFVLNKDRETQCALHQYFVLSKDRETQCALHQYFVLNKNRETQCALHQYFMLNKDRETQCALHQYFVLNKDRETQCALHRNLKKKSSMFCIEYRQRKAVFLLLFVCLF